MDYIGGMAKRKEVRTLDLSLNYIKNYFTKGFDFKSKIARKEYFGSQFLVLLSIVLLILLFSYISFLSSAIGTILGFVLVFYLLAALWCQLPLSVRRLKDAGFNAWWVLIGILPFGGLALFVMHCQPSKNK
jgi:uncharacterized membrane protein YhaH (DUF805 family)